MSEILAFVQNHVFELTSALGIIGAFLFSAWQNSLTSRAIRAQSFVNLLALENDSGFQKGILAITSLKPYTSFAEFDAGEDMETKQAIYDAVVFLNFMAVLGEEGYLHIQDAWDVYFWSYRKCFEKLLPWWLEAYRAHQPNVFPSFERTCRVTSLVTTAQIAAFDRRIGMKHLKKYHQTSQVPRAKLRSVLSGSPTTSTP
ncbi:MAG TPA: hypothetical protein VGF38_02290 [Ktedonobacterales bacterium]|jgi:hypothetical protein